jgi:hypothetical protein
MRLKNHWQAGLNWTYSIRDDGKMMSPPHLVHNSDGILTGASNQAQLDSLMHNPGVQRGERQGAGLQ